MALRFLPDRLPEQEEDHQQQHAAAGGDAGRGRLLVVDDALDVALQCTELSLEVFGSDLGGLVGGHRSGSYFGSLLSVDFLILSSVTTSIPTATSSVTR